MNSRTETKETPAALARLTHYLIIKSIVDVLFVGVFAVGFYYTAFSPYLRGWLDDASLRGVSGWAVNSAEARSAVEVQLYIDGRFVESRLADLPRPDLVAAGATRDERHGFYFFLPPLEEGEHEARVYAVHASGAGRRRTLQQLGNPFRFRMDATPAEPHFRGWLDEANAVSVRGWVVSREDLRARVEVQLYVDGRLVETRVADQMRRDLLDGGIPEAEHGFLFFTPPLPPGEHEARVYAVHRSAGAGERTLRLIGRPARFTIPQ
jgi:hypothetical protein